MEKKKLIYVGVGIIILILTLILFVALASSNGTGGASFSLPSHLDPSSCPEDLSPLPVILFSLDGFHPSYLDRGVTPTLAQMIKKGSSAPFVVSSFPSLTFPNHYTIVTGLYPESHGIISNSFFDSEFDAFFSYKRDESKEGRWWGGEPIWNTLARNNLSSATYFWPGSEAPIGGHKPTYWFKYNGSTPMNERVEKVLEWLKLPASERPSWISLYSSQPDAAGHAFGPDSDQVTEELKKIDSVVQSLLQGLSDAGLLPCVNLLLTTDHGMAHGRPETVIHLDTLLQEDLARRIHFSPGAFGRISLKGNDANLSAEFEESLSCKNSSFQLFRTQDLPKRLHYSNNRRIGDYVLVLDEGYSVNLDSSFYMKGLHGYDSHQTSMHGFFIAYGPAFKEDFKVKPFQNIEVYNLMCRLLDIEPAPNNGTDGLLEAMLKQPTPRANTNQDVKPLPLEARSQRQWMASNEASMCGADTQTFKLTAKLLNLSTEQISRAEEKSAPWGIPVSMVLEDPIYLLHHPDHVTGYSAWLKVPVWTSFEVPRNMPGATPPSHEWLTDFRLPTDLSPPCDNIVPREGDLRLSPLFPPEFSQNEETQILSHLTSNGIMMSTELTSRWDDLLLTLVPKWVKGSKSPVSVILGPIFDADSDGLRDGADAGNETSPRDPSDFFAIASKCSSEVRTLAECPEGRLRAMAFVYPQHLAVEVCHMRAEEFASLFSAKVVDVERLTGLRFFSDVTDDARLQLITSERIALW